MLFCICNQELHKTSAKQTAVHAGAKKSKKRMVGKMWELCLVNDKTAEHRIYFGHGARDCYAQAREHIGADLSGWTSLYCYYID